jgi:hypothetical protein
MGERAVVCVDQGVVSGPRALYSGSVARVLLEAGVANDYFLVHAPQPVIEAVIRTAGRLAPSRRSCRGVEAAT